MCSKLLSSNISKGTSDSKCAYTRIKVTANTARFVFYVSLGLNGDSCIFPAMIISWELRSVTNSVVGSLRCTVHKLETSYLESALVTLSHVCRTADMDCLINQRAATCVWEKNVIKME